MGCQVLHKLVESLPARVRAVAKEQGERAKYSEIFCNEIYVDRMQIYAIMIYVDYIILVYVNYKNQHFHL